MSGQGITQFPNGNRHVGQYNDDQMDGVGVWFDIAAQTKR